MSTGHLMVYAVEGVRHADDKIQAASCGNLQLALHRSPLADRSYVWDMESPGGLQHTVHMQNEDVSARHSFF